MQFYQHSECIYYATYCPIMVCDIHMPNLESMEPLTNPDDQQAEGVLNQPPHKEIIANSGGWDALVKLKK